VNAQPTLGALIGALVRAFADHGDMPVIISLGGVAGDATCGNVLVKKDGTKEFLIGDAIAAVAVARASEETAAKVAEQTIEKARKG
jgi:hypothetical protein